MSVNDGQFPFEDPPVQIGDRVLVFNFQATEAILKGADPDKMALGDDNGSVTWGLVRRVWPGILEIHVNVPNTANFVLKESVAHVTNPKLRANERWRRNGSWDYTRETKELIALRRELNELREAMNERDDDDTPVYDDDDDDDGDEQVKSRPRRVGDEFTLAQLRELAAQHGVKHAKFVNRATIYNLLKKAGVDPQTALQTA